MSFTKANGLRSGLNMTETDGYWCVVCNRYIPEENGVIVHDDIIHPIDFVFYDEETLH